MPTSILRYYSTTLLLLYYQANPATRRGDGGDRPRFCDLRRYFRLSRALGQLSAWLYLPDKRFTPESEIAKDRGKMSLLSN